MINIGLCFKISYTKSDIINAVSLLRELYTLHIEESVNDQITTQNLCWHDLADISINHLFPRVCCVRHDKAKVEPEFLDYLSLHAHDLANGKLMHYFL